MVVYCVCKRELPLVSTPTPQLHLPPVQTAKNGISEGDVKFSLCKLSNEASWNKRVTRAASERKKMMQRPYEKGSALFVSVQFGYDTTIMVAMKISRHISLQAK